MAPYKSYIFFRPFKLKIIMSFWRAAGLNYVQYSNIAARVVRQALKGEARDAAVKRDIVSIKFQKWEQGKPVGTKQ